MNNLLNSKNNDDSFNNENSYNKEKNKQNKSLNININDFQQNIDKKIAITSPKSLLALKICGYKQEDLYKLSFTEFIKANPQIKNISKEFQEHRYFFYENNRKDKIIKAIKTRQQIIDEMENNNISNNKDNDISNIDNNINLNKSNSYNSINNFFNKTLRHYSLINNYNKKNKINNNNNYNSFIGTLPDRSHKLLDYYQLKNENELLNILSNEVNRKIIKKKLLNKEYLKNEYEKQKKEKFEKRKSEENKRLEFARSAKYKLIKEKEEKILKKYQEKEQKIKIRLEQEKQKSKEKEREYQEKDIERKRKLNLYKMQKEKEYNDKHNKSEIKIKLFEEKEKNKLINLMNHRNKIELDRKILSEKTKELIQKRNDSMLSKSQDVLEHYLTKEHNTERILQKNEKERIQNYLLRNKENENMKIQRDKNKENIIKLREAMLMKNKLKMKQIEERQNVIEKNYKKLKEEKRYNLKLEEIRRNQKIKSYEKEIDKKKLNILGNIKNKENKYKEICKQRDDKFKKKVEEINIRKFLIDDKIKNMQNIYDFQRENLKMEIELKLQKAEDYKKEQNKKIEDKKEITKLIKNKINKYREREKEILHQKEIDLKTFENVKDLLPENQQLENLIIKYKQSSLEEKKINKSY